MAIELRPGMPKTGLPGKTVDSENVEENPQLPNLSPFASGRTKKVLLVQNPKEQKPENPRTDLPGKTADSESVEGNPQRPDLSPFASGEIRKNPANLRKLGLLPRGSRPIKKGT